MYVSSLYCYLYFSLFVICVVILFNISLVIMHILGFYTETG